MSSVPFKKKLSYLFAVAAGKDRISSHVFAENDIVPIQKEFGRGIAYHAHATDTLWIEAKPFNGQKDQFQITHCRYHQVHASGVSNKRQFITATLHMKKDGRSVFTRAEALSIIADYEKTFAAKEMLPVAKQPFKRHIKTSLLPNTAEKLSS